MHVKEEFDLWRGVGEGLLVGSTAGWMVNYIAMAQQSLTNAVALNSTPADASIVSGRK